MEYEEYIEFRDLYINHKDIYDKLIDRMMTDIFLMTDRFFDVVGTELLEKDEYNKIVHNNVVEKILERACWYINSIYNKD